MAEHSELVQEMSVVEKMSTQERLKHAKKRRIQQLKKWSQREKEYKRKEHKGQQGGSHGSSSGNKRRSDRADYKVHFVPSVMLLEAAARNDIDEVRRLLMLGVSPDSTNEDGLTALHQCCIDDSEEMMKLLVDFGASVNAKDSEQWTPLHAAATCGHIHLVKYLIQKGADLLAVNADGNMPYDICEDDTTLDYIESEMAKRGVTQEMIDETRAATELRMLSDLKQLLEAGGDLEYRDEQLATPLHIASANGYTSVVEFLLDHHVSTDVCDIDQWQPIHSAACWGHPDVVEMLVQAGASLNAKTKNGETPYDICEDPDLKDRILQLRSEMETKRAAQPNKLRRSQSQNTRSQSVRRTSIREKSQISRREAREEARLRQEIKAATGTAKDSEDEHTTPQKTHSEPTTPASVGNDLGVVAVIGSNANSTSSVEASPVTPVGPGALTLRQYGAAAAMVASSSIVSSTTPTPVDAPPAYAESCAGVVNTSTTNATSTRSSEAVKVEIHVTVNTTSAGISTSSAAASATSLTPSPPLPLAGGTGGTTLADLKKHRTDLRMRTGSVTSTTTIENGSTTHPHHHHHNNNNNNSNMAAPSVGGGGTNLHNMQSIVYPAPLAAPVLGGSTENIKKFRSDPNDVVGDPKERKCCCFM